MGFRLLVMISCFSYVELFANGVELPQDRIDMVESALQIALPATHQKSTPEVQEIRTILFSEVRAGNYRGALNIVLSGLEQYPDDFLLQTLFATMLGDFAGEFPGPYRKRMEERSKEIFSKLGSEIQGQPQNDIFFFNNEYCYRLALYKQQYENGVSGINYYEGIGEIPTLGYMGYYYQGVGAANYAKTLLLDGDREQAGEYAQKALVAWSRYFSYCSNYYNAYVHYGLALGILGYTEEMYRACHQGAVLIQKNLDYVEFKEVIDFVTLIQ